MLRHTIAVKHHFAATDPIPGEFEKYVNIPFIPDMMVVRNTYYYFFGFGSQALISEVDTEVTTTNTADGSTSEGTDTYAYAVLNNIQETSSSILYCEITDCPIGMIADTSSVAQQPQPLYFQLNGPAGGKPVRGTYRFRIENSDGTLRPDRGGLLLVFLEFQKNISE